MFEQSLVVSQRSPVSRATRWTWSGSIVLQCCAAALLVVLPLLHPERFTLIPAAPQQAYLPRHIEKPHPPVVRHIEPQTSASSSAIPAANTQALAAPTILSHGITAGDPPPIALTSGFISMGTALPGEIASASPSTRVSVNPAPRADAHGPVRISSGVAAGMLTSPIRPVYPAIARAAHIGGSVVISAIISRSGQIEQARVLSGPPMLAGAALDALRAARYTPFRLNNVAVEVETTIVVNFTIGG